MKDTSLSPDCALNKPLLLVDDLNPGPSIRANVGDTVRVTLMNKSPNEAASLHFHGLTMLDQPYADGVPMVNQCALGPNQRQVYEFTALSAGTHYWHGHLSMDIADGVQGPIIISDPYNVDEKELATMYDEEIIVSLQDWYHLSGQVRRTGLDTNPFIWIGNAQSFLINGGGESFQNVSQLVAMLVLRIVPQIITSKPLMSRPGRPIDCVLFPPLSSSVSILPLLDTT